MKQTLNPPVHEKKLSSLLTNIADKKNKNLLEASGVVVVDNEFFVIFDEMHGIARIPKSKKNCFQKGSIVGSQKIREGFEAIAYNANSHLFYAIVENAPYRHGYHRPQLQQFDMNLNKVGFPSTLPLNLPLDNINPNKGLEGAAIIHRNNRTFLFGLCEGKGCNSDDSKSAKGRAMIQIFEKAGDRWKYRGPLLLPKKLNFRDFSDLAIRKNRIAVVSQKSSKLWIGKLQITQNSWRIKHKGTYSFPKKNGKIIYCNVEGVDWVSKKQLVIVSDMASKKHCKKKEMMIHLFNIPQ